MDATQVGIVTVPVVTLVQMAKFAGLPGRWAPLLASLLSALGVVLLILASPTGFVAQMALDYFVAFTLILAAAMGVYGFVANATASTTPMGRIGNRTPGPPGA